MNDTTTQTMPTSVQILSTLLFAAFAIPVTIVALNIFWPAGIALALILGWRGGFAPTQGNSAVRDLGELIQKVQPDSQKQTSGNATFDAYRTDTMARLEQEQVKFEGFLDRLRAAKDKVEFDQFMDDRATRTAAPPAA